MFDTEERSFGVGSHFTQWICPSCGTYVMEIGEHSGSLTVAQIEYLSKRYNGHCYVKWAVHEDAIDNIEDHLLKRNKRRLVSKYKEKRYIP